MKKFMLLALGFCLLSSPYLSLKADRTNLKVYNDTSKVITVTATNGEAPKVAIIQPHESDDTFGTITAPSDIDIKVEVDGKTVIDERETISSIWMQVRVKQAIDDEHGKIQYYLD